MKYSDCISRWLRSAGYDTCFYVAGGNIMHLLESISKEINCIPVIHEVAAGIAAEYYTEINKPNRKAFALVTAGPGLTNILTAMAGAYLESRSLLVIGGQVKVSDLNDGSLRQRGIQEIDGVALARPVSKCAILLKEPMPAIDFAMLLDATDLDRPGPVFIEIPLDVQGMQVEYSDLPVLVEDRAEDEDLPIDEIMALLKQAKRPSLLLGGGMSWETCQRLQVQLQALQIPIFTTWNGFDRLCASAPNYFGRPNTWGQRYSNILLQQSDLLIVLGSRLGMQQTGFNWKSFLQHGDIVQVDIDAHELNKGHPVVKLKIQADANELLAQLIDAQLPVFPEWLAYCKRVKSLLPLIEDCNQTGENYLSPYRVIERISAVAHADDIIIPCSSGSAFTVSMQAFHQTFGQRVVTNKGLASMGYGLSGAIGAAVAQPTKRIFLIEGDGGFAQNMQEIGTVAINQLNIKMFIFFDEGYASIRMTQRNYFKGRYLGCDTKTGLGLPNYNALFACYGIPCMDVRPGDLESDLFNDAVSKEGPCAFIVHIDPDQSYFPKITSRVLENGAMESNPLHLMTPELHEDLWKEVSVYL